MDNLEPITRNEMFLNGDDLEPITREEMILAGADLEPITRHEWFLKRYRGGGGGGGYDLVNIPDLPADIASFNDGTDLPMASLKVTVTPYQDLSHGDPSPENICPIIGWDEAVVTVADDAESPTTSHEYTIDLDGTRYGGVVDATNGVLTVDRAFLSNDYLVNTASYESAGRGCFALIGISLNSMGSDVVDTKLMASALKTSSQNDLYTNKNVGIAHWWNTRIGFSTGDETITTVSAFKQWLTDNGSDVVYELATPITVQLAPTAVKSLEGVNKIYANCGQITEGKYFKRA